MILGFLGIDPVTWIGDAVLHAASTTVADLVGVLAQALAGSTVITFGSRFTNVLRVGLVLTGILGVGAIAFAVIRASLTRNMSRLGSDLLRIGAAILATFVAIPLIPLLQHISIDAGRAVLDASAGSPSAATFGVLGAHGAAANQNSLAAALNNETMALGGIITAVIMILLSVIFIFTAYVALLVSEALLYICIFFFPLTFVISQKWGRRVAEVGVAMILVPFVISSFLAIGIAVNGDGPNVGVTFGHLLIGTGIFAFAAASPMMAHKILRGGLDAVGKMREGGHAALGHAATAATHAGRGVGAAAEAGGGAARAAKVAGQAAGAAGAGPAGVAAASALAAMQRLHQQRQEKAAKEGGGDAPARDAKPTPQSAGGGGLAASDPSAAARAAQAPPPGQTGGGGGGGPLVSPPPVARPPQPGGAS